MPTGQRNTSRRQAPRKRQHRTLFVLAGFAALIVFILAGAFLSSRSSGQAGQAGAVTIANTPAPATAEPHGRAWGPKDAPIQVIEYADYECEACGFFARTYEADFVAAFANTGKVRFEIRNAPFHGQGARNAAEGAYCAAEQNAFWPMHESLFLNQPTREGAGVEAFSDARLNAIAAELDIETAAFGQCLSSGTYTQQVETDYNETRQNSVTATPTFIINGTAYPGVLSVDDFRRIFADVAPNVTFNS